MRGVKNHKPKPCQRGEISSTIDVIHTDGMFSGKREGRAYRSVAGGIQDRNH